MGRQLQRDGGALHEELQLIDGRRIHTSRGLPFLIPDNVRDEEVVALVLDGSNRFTAVDSATMKAVNAERLVRDEKAAVEEEARLEAIEEKRADRVAAEEEAAEKLEEELAAFKKTADHPPTPEPAPAPVDERPTTDVPGIGPVASEKLEDEGIVTVADLAKSDPVTVGEALGVTEAKAKVFIDAAIDLRSVA